MADPDLSRLKRPDDYAATRPAIFKSRNSWTWFKRVHGEELRRRGGMYRLFGQDLIDPETVDGYLLELGRKQATAATAATEAV